MAITTTAPINKLPAEILTEILSAAVAGQMIHLTGIETPMPASLSFVCRVWREVVLSRPEFWASVAFDTQQIHPKIDLPQLLDLYFSRSKNAPLSISGTLLREDDSSSFDTILRQSRRWRSIHLHFHPAYIPTLNQVQHKVPLLERLSLDLTHPMNDTRWLDDEITAFLDAPSLRSISGCDRSLRHAILPSEQITTLTGYAAELRFCTILAKSYHNLRQLTLRDWRCPSNFSHAPNLDLRSLCLVQDRDSFFTSLSQVFTLLVLPQLRSLHVEGSTALNQRLDWNVFAFAIMAERFMPFSLTTLRLGHVYMSEADLLASLLSLPMLETLVIVDGHRGRLTISDTFLKGITWPCHTCPELKTLSMSGRLRFDDDSLVEMVKSRLVLDSDAQQTRTVAKLRSLSVTTSNSGRMGLIRSRLLALGADLIVNFSIIDDKLQTAACPDCQRF